MGAELEIKYTAENESILDAVSADPEILCRAAEPSFRHIQMETTYFDTPGGALSARKWAFRRRMENGRSVVTLKTPGEGYARGEWEWEGHDLLEAAAHLTALGAPEELSALLSAAEPSAVCGARFTRRAMLLRLDGAVCELCLDAGMLLGGGKELPLFEMELELKGGEAGPMLRFARLIAGKYGLHEEKRGKFSRARALCAQQ